MLITAFHRKKLLKGKAAASRVGRVIITLTASQNQLGAINLRYISHRLIPESLVSFLSFSPPSLIHSSLVVSFSKCKERPAKVLCLNAYISGWDGFNF